MKPPDMYVRIDALGKVGLPGDELLRATVRALTELAVAEALVMIHGRERGYRRYVEAGGAVRFTSYGEPFMPVCSVPQKYRTGLVLRSWTVREDVVSAQLSSGRLLEADGGSRRRVRWWDLTLACGHVVQRNVQYVPRPDGNPDRERRLAEDAKPAPKRVRCGECISILSRSAACAQAEAKRKFIS